MVDVRVGQLRRSRDRLEARGEEAASGGDQVTAGLLLFYSAECGLKAEVLAAVKAQSTAQLPDGLRSHDLRALAKELRLPRRFQDAVSACKRVKEGQARPPQVESHALHQAWRYGADLESEGEKRAIAGLRMLISESRK
ncbi:hypothetical protein RKE29_12630 [Streptomyces sp. B1866]|uniref:hypothetical protein n=1 Tax=Streptomyces sp. B1866 TaxID=3075431 RepID=UPI00289024C2|nr:hypothetical protein [Streptomyces sp. B1866]MDT3397485.1 hypothetical protein [Streptomyces sp. B1866]